MLSSDRKYRARVWRTHTLLKKAEEDLDIMIEALLPERYSYKIEDCDREVAGFPYAPHHKFCGRLDAGPGDPAHMVFGYTVGEVKAKLVGILFSGSPCFPLT